MQNKSEQASYPFQALWEGFRRIAYLIAYIFVIPTYSAHQLPNLNFERNFCWCHMAEKLLYGRAEKTLCSTRLSKKIL